MTTTTIITQPELDMMVFDLGFRTELLSPYGEIYDTRSNRIIGYSMPCYAVGRKSCIALLRSKEDGELFLISVLIDKNYRRPSEQGINVLKTVLDSAMSSRYVVLAAGMNGCRWSFQSDHGYHMFGIDNYPVTRIWNHKPREDHMSIVFGENTFGIQPISYARWVNGDPHGYKPTEAETQSYRLMCLGLLPELNARLIAQRMKVERNLHNHTQGVIDGMPTRAPD